jgi:hypothetical protein
MLLVYLAYAPWSLQNGAVLVAYPYLVRNVISFSLLDLPI